MRMTPSTPEGTEMKVRSSELICLSADASPEKLLFENNCKELFCQK